MPEEGRFAYGVSIGMAKATAPETLLAHTMNGEALAPEHGFPLRAVVPGYAGVRSPKWLAAITVQDRPSDNHMQQRDYKLLPPGVTEETVDWRKGVTIDAMPLTSAVCQPGGRRRAGRGPRERCGATPSPPPAPWPGWTCPPTAAGPGRRPSWRTTRQRPGAGRSGASRWTCRRGRHELAVRAWDSAGQTQPALPDDVWNFKGYLSTAWHRVHVSAI